MVGMEFKYKLTEAEYLLASKIVVKRPGRPWARTLSYGYLAVIFLIIWGAFLAGMFLEQENLVGITAAEIQQVHAMQKMVPASIVPVLGIFGLALLFLRLRPLRFLDRNSRIEHFRTDPGCQAETTVTVTPESIGFRSATGFSESIWECYATWVERNGILILVTRAGVRKILKITGLSDSDKDELRGLLTAALLKR
jgi:hypothetical protein